MKNSDIDYFVSVDKNLPNLCVVFIKSVYLLQNIFLIKP